jgi:hypothetical protein
MMTQEQAVYLAVTNVMGEQEAGTAYQPTKEQRGAINEILVEGFRAGKIALKETPSNREKLDNVAELRSYCSGLQSNWLRKDKRLNGGIKYVPKNPGSRAGSTDPQVKAMRALLSTREDLGAEDRAEIQALIQKRIAETKPTKSVKLSDEQVETLKAAGLGHLFE